MSEEIIISEKNKIEAHYNAVCQEYGVACKFISTNKYVFSDEQEHYLVFGVNGVPENLNVKDIYVRNERSNMLFYPDYFVIKINEDSSKLGLVESAISYCKTVEFLKKLYAEHGLPLPEKIRGDEIGALKEHNLGRKNKNLSPERRALYEKHIKKFFKEEKSKSKYLKKWRDFYRSDKFDRRASYLKMFSDFSKRNEQITPLSQLHETNDDLKSTIINEHEFVKFKEDMKRLYPDVLYSVSKLEVQNEGFEYRKYKNKPVNKIPDGPFGKLVTYQTYCEEVEKHFADEGYESILSLNPTYYETRQLFYKEIDEPLIASVINSIRFAYAKSNSLQSISSMEYDDISMIDVPVEDMMNFVSLAKANHVPFYLDFFGKFGKADFEKIRVVYNMADDEMMGNIVVRMISEKFKYSHISTSIENNSPSLEKQIHQAQHVRIVPSENVKAKSAKRFEL